MIFVDSSGWYASAVPSELDHQAAITWLNQNSEPLVTTDYVVDETLTLLRGRRQARLALAMGRQFFQGNLAVVHYLDEAEIRLAWETFERYSDKE